MVELTKDFVDQILYFFKYNKLLQSEKILFFEQNRFVKPTKYFTDLIKFFS